MPAPPRTSTRLPVSSHRRPRSPGRSYAIGIGTIAAVAFIVVLLTTIINGGKTATSGVRNPAPVPEYQAPVASLATSPTVVTTRTTPTTTTVTTAPVALTDPSAARAALEAQVAEDRVAVEALVGFWVPQLSSKRVGLTVYSVTYDYPAIWRDFVTTKSKYPDVRLLWSGNFSVYLLGDFWVTIKPQPSADGAIANAWCDTQYIPKDDCYAKLISHSHSSRDATLHRSN